MKSFHKEFKTLAYVFARAERILLFAHTRPDPDSVGANMSLYFYLTEQLGKEVDIACWDEYPEKLQSILPGSFSHPDTLNLESYDVVVAADSPDRGFNLLRDKFHEDQVVALIDHHPDITVTGDIVLIDERYSSTCEIIYLFFEDQKVSLPPKVATALLTGILFDTGGFQHASVTPQIMHIASSLMRAGAPLGKISKTLFAQKNFPAMRLWGRAVDKIKYVEKEGMLVTAVTQEDIKECEANADDIYELASVLCTVPNIRYAMVLSEREPGLIRANLRAMKHSNMDVSALAHQFGGGGHKLASGFELPGTIIETEDSYSIV
jgi:phosphoesterase RecJ-like protein